MSKEIVINLKINGSFFIALNMLKRKKLKQSCIIFFLWRTTRHFGKDSKI